MSLKGLQHYTLVIDNDSNYLTHETSMKSLSEITIDLNQGFSSSNSVMEFHPLIPNLKWFHPQVKLKRNSMLQRSNNQIKKYMFHLDVLPSPHLDFLIYLFPLMGINFHMPLDLNMTNQVGISRERRTTSPFFAIMLCNFIT